MKHYTPVIINNLQLQQLQLHTNNLDESQIKYRVNKTRPLKLYTVRFQLYKIHNQTNLVYEVRRQSSGYH